MKTVVRSSRCDKELHVISRARSLPLGTVPRTMPPNGGGDTQFASVSVRRSPRMALPRRRHNGTRIRPGTPVSPVVIRHPEADSTPFLPHINDLPRLEADRPVAFYSIIASIPLMRTCCLAGTHSIAFWDNVQHPKTFVMAQPSLGFPHADQVAPVADKLLALPVCWRRVPAIAPIAGYQFIPSSDDNGLSFIGKTGADALAYSKVAMEAAASMAVQPSSRAIRRSLNSQQINQAAVNHGADVCQCLNGNYR